MYVRERRDLDVDGRRIWVVLARSAGNAAACCAEKSGVLRVKDYKQSVAMESDGRGGTRGGASFKSMQEDVDVVTDRKTNFFHSVFMNYFDNPGGMIPAWLVNWTAKVNPSVSHHALLEPVLFQDVLRG